MGKPGNASEAVNGGGAIEAKVLQLPHTGHCLVCGRDNPRGLKLDLFVEPLAGVVTARFVPDAHHVGFEGIIHGGMLATVLDEAMTWAATWVNRRFCVCGEMTVRLRKAAEVGRPLLIEARVTSARQRLIETSAELIDEADGAVVAAGTGKYVPIPPERHERFVKTFVTDVRTREAAEALGVGHRNPNDETRNPNQ